MALHGRYQTVTKAATDDQ